MKSFLLISLSKVQVKAQVMYFLLNQVDVLPEMSHYEIFHAISKLIQSFIFHLEVTLLLSLFQSTAESTLKIQRHISSALLHLSAVIFSNTVIICCLQFLNTTLCTKGPFNMQNPPTFPLDQSHSRLIKP